MPRSRHLWLIGFGFLALAFPACMTPGAPAPTAAGAAAGGAAAGAAGTPGAAEQPALAADPELAPPAGPLGKCCKAIDDCRRKLCKTPLGKMINGMTMPVSALTGGVIPTFCPATPNAAELMKAGAQGEAAAIKKDAIEAKARRDAVKMLGTVDCRYYADAEGKLIAALRTDGIECVRLEAAMSLGRGCCCTKKVIRALEICVAGTEEDGHPAERSSRVRDIAAESLNRCMACAPPELLEPDVKPETDDNPELQKSKDGNKKKDEPKNPMAERKPDRKTIEKAQATLAKYNAKKAMEPPIVVEEKSFYGLFKSGLSGTKSDAGKQAIQSPEPMPLAATEPTELPALATPVSPSDNPPVRAMPAANPPERRSSNLLLPD